MYIEGDYADVKSRRKVIQCVEDVDVSFEVLLMHRGTLVPTHLYWIFYPNSFTPVFKNKHNEYNKLA